MKSNYPSPPKLYENFKDSSEAMIPPDLEEIKKHYSSYSYFQERRFVSINQDIVRF